MRHPVPDQYTPVPLEFSKTYMFVLSVYTKSEHFSQPFWRRLRAGALVDLVAAAILPFRRGTMIVSECRDSCGRRELPAIPC